MFRFISKGFVSQLKMRGCIRGTKKYATPLIVLVLLNGCHPRKSAVTPSIKFTRVPQTSTGDPHKLDIIQGRVEGAHPGQRIVLYVKTGAWWVQPLSSEPFTEISPNSSWINSTHLGSEYAALLVEPGYQPQTTLNNLPTPGNEVAAIATSKDDPSASVVSPTLQFSGYEWRIRNAPSNRGDRVNPYSPANAWTDANGSLHLRVANESGKWTCAEVTLTRSFGYGLYSFVVRDTSKLGPRVVFAMFTWDYAGGDQNHREMSVEVGHRSNAGSQNAQYVVQPFHVAENVAKFTSPASLVTHSFRWEPGRLSFKTIRGSGTASDTVLGEHIFTSGVPSPGVETVRMALYIFGTSTDDSMQEEAEVVVDKFEFLP